MSLVVEDGTGLPRSNSYVSLDQASSYSQSVGSTDWGSSSYTDEDRSAALIRATAFVDATYRDRFPGYRLTGRRQALEWPRAAAYTTVVPRGDEYFAVGYIYQAGYSPSIDDYLVPSDEVPREVVAATCQAAVRELVSPGSLSPDLDRGGRIRTASAGSVSVTYADDAPATTTFQQLDLVLASLLVSGSSVSGTVGRG